MHSSGIKDICAPDLLSFRAINFNSCVSNVVLISVRKYKHFRRAITDVQSVLWFILVRTCQGMHYFHALTSAEAEINLISLYLLAL
jgi:hypothetical protein